MPYLATDKSEEEFVFDSFPERSSVFWCSEFEMVQLPKGSIKRLTGKTITWNDEPLEFNTITTQRPNSITN